VPHPEQSERVGYRQYPTLTPKGDTVGEFPTSLCKLPQTPFFKRDGPKLRVLLRVLSGWPTIPPELRLKLRELGAILQCMAAVRSLAAVLLVVLASTLTAQNASTGQVVVSVIDQSGAVIPGAHIGIIRLPSVVPNDGDWLHYALHASEQASAHTDAYGGATVGLAKGIYAITIAANGFQRHLDRIEIRNEPSQALRATLLLADCTNCVEVTPGITIPLEYASSLNIFIPLEPLQTITVTNARVRRRWLRF
jgi:hypothetical protein